MDVKRWEALIAAVDKGSFTAAAEFLGYTQSGLTHMMNRLENEIGFKLLHRGRDGIHLTAEGEKLMPKIKNVLQANDELFDSIANIDDSKHMTLRIGSYASIIHNWIPSITSHFCAIHPEVNIELFCGTMKDMNAKMQENAFDIIFSSKGAFDGLEWFPLANDPMLAILPPDFKADNTEFFDIMDFGKANFLIPSFGCNSDAMPLLKDCKLTPSIVLDSVDDSALISMVEHGLGVSLLSELIMRGRRNDVITMPIRPAASRQLGMMVKGSALQNKIVKEFIDCAKEVVGKM